MLGDFGAWLQGEMDARRIRSASRLAREAGLDPNVLIEWVLGRQLPNDEECALLGAHLGFAAEDVRDRAYRSLTEHRG
jgi:hypothetical protein